LGPLHLDSRHKMKVPENIGISGMEISPAFVNRVYRNA